MAKMLSFSLSSTEDRQKLHQLLISWINLPITWGVIGFLIGRAAIFGEIWPFGLAYIAVLRRMRTRKLTLPIIGVALGLTVSLGIRLALPYYAVLGVLALAPIKGERSGQLWLGSSILVVKMGLHYAVQPVPMVVIVAITECVFATFITRLLYPALKRCDEQDFAWSELYVFLIMLILIISFGLNWYGFSLRLFLVCILIALGARLGGLTVSCILGPALALLTLLLGESIQMVLFIIIASLLTGFLYKHAWGYYVGPFLALLFSNPDPAGLELMAWFLMILTAILVQSRVPQENLDLLARIIPGTDSFQIQNQAYDSHLKKIFDQKIDGYLTVFEELEKNLLKTENPLFHKQMHSMAELLKTMKSSFSPEAAFTKELEEILLRRFSHADLAHITVLPTLDGFEIYGACKERCLTGTFCQEVAEFASGTITSQRYGVTNCNCQVDKVCGFRISPSPNYKLEIGKAKVASQGVSGDNQITFEIASSKVAIVLSDGMGVGLKAHTESDAALRLLERMLKAGYDLTTSVSLINRLLMLRNHDDMFVTIDLVVVDLFSGQVEFVKIGASPSFIKRGREVEIIYNRTLPVGMLSQVDLESDRRMLQEGEVLIMTTDGVLDVQRNIVRKDEWMCWNLRRLIETEDVSTMAESILTDSIGVANGRVDDDMMVVVARLVPANLELESYRRAQSSG